MNKNILVIGGGLAGASLAHYLNEKDYKVEILEPNPNGVGGMCRTYKYAGHPYEFGPHIWFWPGGKEDPINNTIVKLSNDELFYINRRLFTFVEKDKKKYRYPVHFEDIDKMPEKEQILDELKLNRDNDFKLDESKLPTIGKCSFEDYFTSAIGNTIYNKFMKNYSWKMWNIPGDKLQTSMVWADRFKHAYSSDDELEKVPAYDPLKFEDHTLGKGIKFQIYPKKGWSYILDKMVENANVIFDGCNYIDDSVQGDEFVLSNSGKKYYFKDYHAVINTLDLDNLWGEDTLPYTGRMMIPLVIPSLGSAFPENAESLHYSSCEFQTRVTEMKVITKHDSLDTLILIEVPILPGADEYFPENVMTHAKEHNLFVPKAYPQQSKKAFEIYNNYLNRCKKIKNLFNCGRHAEFKYWGMPETVNSAYNLVKDKF